MQVKTGRFFAGLLLITAIIGLFAFILFRTILQAHYPVIFPYMLGFFFLLNCLFFMAVVRIQQQDSNIFIRQFMILFGVKFFIYLIAAVAVILLNKNEAVDIAVSAMILYLLYTGYEVFWLTTLAKRKEQK